MHVVPTTVCAVRMRLLPLAPVGSLPSRLERLHPAPRLARALSPQATKTAAIKPWTLAHQT